MPDRLAMGADEVDAADGDAGLARYFAGSFCKHLSQGDIKAAEEIDRAQSWVRGGEDGLAHTLGKWIGMEGMEVNAR
jgi:hypothetical protein